MVDEMVAVKVSLEGGKSVTLRFRPDVYEHHAALARSEGRTLQDYLARRILASGIGADAAAEPEQEPALAGAH